MGAAPGIPSSTGQIMKTAYTRSKNTWFLLYDVITNGSLLVDPGMNFTAPGTGHAKCRFRIVSQSAGHAAYLMIP